MSSLDVTTDAARRPFSGRRVRLGDLHPAGRRRRSPRSALVLVGLIAWKIVQGARLSISTFGLSFVWHVDLGPGPPRVRRGQLPLRHRGHLVRRADPRHADRARHRALPQRAGAPRDSRAGHRTRRDARRDSERRDRALGDPRPRAAPARPRRAGAPLGARLHPALRPAANLRLEHLHGDRRPDDHDPADHREHLARALPRRADGAEGGGARPRHDALGDDPRRRPPLLARRRRGRDDPRPRPCDRRGDRRRAGDRRLHRHQTSTSSTRATRSRAKIALSVQGASSGARDLLAHLPARSSCSSSRSS